MSKKIIIELEDKDFEKLEKIKSVVDPNSTMRLEDIAKDILKDAIKGYGSVLLGEQPTHQQLDDFIKQLGDLKKLFGEMPGFSDSSLEGAFDNIFNTQKKESDKKEDENQEAIVKPKTTKKS